MEVLLVGHGIKANPHIKSRIKVFKKQFQIVQELRGLSGVGWNDELKCVSTGDSSFSEHVQMYEIADSRAPKDDHFEGFNIDNVIPIVDEETDDGFEHQTNDGVDVTARNEKDKGTLTCPTSQPKLVPKRRVRPSWYN
ncbi:hypothetical protein LINPERHAP2_LOCUS27246 [Linum perenne]